jgi:geranylgeranyl pyrophosphate synthase
MTSAPESTPSQHGLDVSAVGEAAAVLNLQRGSAAVADSVACLFPQHDAAVRDFLQAGALPPASAYAARAVRRFMIDPVRTIADRGGKGWRSYAMLVACEAVGGDSSPLRPFVGVIELLHVGSLIVDDVQDGSTLRRGGPCCHEEVGVPLAINAGNSAYFLWDRLVGCMPVPAEERVELYRLYFECMRAAHAGQALDIAGLSDLMTEAVRSGDAAALLDAVTTIHTYKTGAPVSLCLSTGAIVGLASKAQRAALAGHAVSMGIAFQIGDDVLNLRGFAQHLKEPGEDIAGGKVTYPVAWAFCRLPRSKREDLWARLAARDGSRRNVQAVLGILESVDACGGALAEAESQMNHTWSVLAPLLPETRAKAELHAYGALLLRRHY